jgi:hypothetical protein
MAGGCQHGGVAFIYPLPYLRAFIVLIQRQQRPDMGFAGG